MRYPASNQIMNALGRGGGEAPGHQMQLVWGGGFHYMIRDNRSSIGWGRGKGGDGFSLFGYEQNYGVSVEVCLAIWGASSRTGLSPRLYKKMRCWSRGVILASVVVWYIHGSD